MSPTNYKLNKASNVLESSKYPKNLWILYWLRKCDFDSWVYGGWKFIWKVDEKRIIKIRRN